MLELIKSKLKKPESYCPQILCEIGSSFINSYPKESKLISEPHCIALGKYILQKILGLPITLPVDTLYDIAELKRWDVTPTHQHKFFQPVNQQNLDYFKLLDDRFNSLLQDSDRQTNLLSLLNNAFIKYFSTEEYYQISETLEKNDIETAYQFAIDKLNELNIKLFDQALSAKQENVTNAQEKNKYIILKYCNLLQLPFDGFLKDDYTLIIFKDNDKFIPLLIENIKYHLERIDHTINFECDELQNDIHSISVSVDDYQESFLSGKLIRHSTACKELINTSLTDASNRFTALQKQIIVLEQFEAALLSTTDDHNVNLSCQVSSFKSKLILHIDKIKEQISDLKKFDKQLYDTEQGAQCCEKSTYYKKLTQHYKEIKELYLTIKERADHYVKTLNQQIKEFRNEIYDWIELFYKYENNIKLLAPESIFRMQRKTINQILLSGEKIVNKIEMFQDNFNNIKKLLQQYSDKSNNLVDLCQTIQSENSEELMSRLFYTRCRSLFNRSTSQFKIFLSPQANFALDNLRADGENILDKLNKLKELKTASETVTPPRPLKPVSQKRQGSDDLLYSPHRKNLKKEIGEAGIIETDKENYSSHINNTRRLLFM